jgi:hypothetical protein
MITIRRWAAAVLLVGLVAGCGIPDNTVAVPRGELGSSTGVSSGGDLTPSKPGRLDSNDRAEFVTNYLQAAAGDPDSAGVPEQVRQFLSPAAANTFKPGQGIRVVRPVEKPLVNLNTGRVTVRVDPVGTLGADGILEPSAGPVTPYTFVVGELPGNSGLFITEAPQTLLLSDTALNKFYTRRAIYFWNRDHTSLVPDLRYLSLSVPREQQPTQVIEWLANGPAEWLVEDAVERLPAGTKLRGNVPAGSGDKLQINLSGQALPAEDSKAALDRLGRQLMWSLRPNLATTPALELQIAGQVVGDFTGDAYLTSNAASRFTSTPEQFAVYDGRIRRLAQSQNPVAPIPGVPERDNRNVQTAALTSLGGFTHAALVAIEAGRPVLKVGTAPTGTPATFRTIGLKSPIGRPVWAVTSDGTSPGNAVGLITAGGELYSFGPRGVGGARLADWPRATGPITGVSVAPDGHRIAVVAGGRLYLAVMTGNGNGMQLSTPQEIRTLLRDLTVVDWGSESTLVVAGTHATSNRIAVAYVSADGASQTDRLDDLGTARVTHLVAYPANPMNPTDDPGAVAYVADRAAYNVLKDPERIAPDDLVGPLPDPPPAAGPTAPFFLY